MWVRIGGLNMALLLWRHQLQQKEEPVDQGEEMISYNFGLYIISLQRDSKTALKEQGRKDEIAA